MFDKVSLPTAKAKLLLNHPPQGFGQGITEAGFEIDYFFVRDLDNPVKLINERADLDSNIPEGRGCSEFLNQIEPNLEPKSFTMIYKLKSSRDYNMLAYDLTQNLLRKEIISEQTSIWSLDEELLYNMHPNVSNLLQDQHGLNRYIDACSTLKVSDKRLSSIYRPQQEAMVKGWDIRTFLKANKLAYIGKGHARELPCVIYETITEEIPAIFGNSYLAKLSKLNSGQNDYIIQFHLIDNFSKDIDVLSEKIDEVSFWPARITLFARNQRQDTIVELEQVDVDDFYCSLDGRNKRKTEMFILDECFHDEGEQMRLELTMTFDQIHTGVVDESKKKLLMFNKFKLEFDLLNEVCKSLNVNRIHLISSKLSLHPNHILLDLTFGDRRNSKVLSYFGEGSLVTSSSYEDSRMVTRGLSEEKCLMLSSHVNDISMVIYCPEMATLPQSTCTSIFSEVEPTIRTKIDSENYPECRLYRFKYGDQPDKGTMQVLENSWNLTTLNQWSFSAKDLQYRNTEVQLSAHLEDYYLSFNTKLVTINNYLLAKDLTDSSGPYLNNPNVRSFENSLDGTGVELMDAHDCAKICNLDPWCRSYSYCTFDKACSISRMDLRKSSVGQKLAAVGSSKTIEGRQSIQVSDVERYELLFSQGCNIYERNYLDMFNPTNEILRISKSNVQRYPAAVSTFDCAKLSVDLEMKSSSHHVAMFAFCPSKHINACILEEKLFKDTISDKEEAQNEDQYVRCRVYKRRFHTYFNMSSKVIEVKDPSQQVTLPFKMVEDCARACLTQYGQVCSSFDFCAAQDQNRGCIINTVDTSSPEVELKIRPGCLHYQRDLRFDRVLREHMIGRHEPLTIKPEQASESSQFWSYLVTLVTYCIIGGVFVYGMSLGKRANDELDSLIVRLRPLNRSVGAQSFASVLRNSNSAGITSEAGSSILNAIELEDCRISPDARER